MKQRTTDLTNGHALRDEAATRLAGGPTKQSNETARAKLQHELEVHRIELEMQNEQLRAAQMELEAGLDRYVQLFDFAPIGYATLTANGTVLEVNHVGATLLGKSRKDVTGRPFLRFIAPHDRPAFTGLLDALLADHLKKTCEVELLQGIDERPTVRLTVSTLAAREPTILLAFEDISKQKRNELALRRADEELRQADRRKDDFLAVLSHELRTPLSSILMHAQLLRRDTPDPSVRRSGELIERAARTQARIVEDLLDVSRIVAGKLSLKRDQVDLPTIVRAAVDAVAEQAKKRKIDVVVAMDDSVSHVMGDPVRLQQVVSNLLTNAIKFTPAQGQIEVRLDEVHRRARLQVKDSGVGIEPALLPHLFERFFQADRSSTRRTGGLGLGLSIAHAIVEAHHGELRAESAGPGKGSTFTTLLPVELTRATSKRTDGESRDELNGRIRGARILVVEDDAETRATLTHVLEVAGAKVRNVDSAAAAMKALGRFEPDLLLCDVGLPEEDGCGLLRRIRAKGKEHGGDVRAIALTAFADNDTRAQTRAAGFEVHLVKPVDIDRLLATVSGMLPSGPDMGAARRAT